MLSSREQVWWRWLMHHPPCLEGRKVSLDFQTYRIQDIPRATQAHMSWQLLHRPAPLHVSNNPPVCVKD